MMRLGKWRSVWLSELLHCFFESDLSPCWYACYRWHTSWPRPREGRTSTQLKLRRQRSLRIQLSGRVRYTSRENDFFWVKS